MRWVILGAVFALTLSSSPAAVAQDPAPRPGRPGEADARAEELRERVLGRFLERASQELELTSEQETRLREEFRQIQETRRSLIREQRELRQQLERSTREGTATDAEAQRLLRRAGELKAREAELWREEQERIGRVLTPRQQARFLILQERFAQRVRDVRRDRRMDRTRPRPERRERQESGERRRPPK